jgi:hypothetical protein
LRPDYRLDQVADIVEIVNPTAALIDQQVKVMRAFSNAEDEVLMNTLKGAARRDVPSVFRPQFMPDVEREHPECFRRLAAAEIAGLCNGHENDGQLLHRRSSSCWHKASVRGNAVFGRYWGINRPDIRGHSRNVAYRFGLA